MNSGFLGRVAAVLLLISGAAYAADTRSILRLDPNLTRSWSVGRIVTIAPNQIQVKGSSGQMLQAAPAANINNGQLVWIGPKQLAFVLFPIEESRSDNVSVGHMQSDVKVSNTGILRVKTHTWTNNAVQGFEGGVIVVLMKSDGNDLWVSPLHKYGVNGTAVPGAPSSRTVDWTENVPLAAINDTAQVAIIQLNAPTNKIDDFLANAKKVADIAKTVSETYKNVAGGGGGGNPGGGGGGTTTTTPP
jgi:hypothetical protein